MVALDAPGVGKDALRLIAANPPRLEPLHEKLGMTVWRETLHARMLHLVYAIERWPRPVRGDSHTQA